MGHNYSDRKLAGIRRRNAADARRGWLVDSSGQATPVPTPLGLLARRSVLQGGCSRHPTCSRRVVFDARPWCDQGMGEVSVTTLQASYRCALVACQLRWQAERYPDGLPLAAHLGDETASVTVSCRSCRRRRRSSLSRSSSL